jgi:hypothetical protein
LKLIIPAYLTPRAKGTDTYKKREELKKNIKKLCKFRLETYQIPSPKAKEPDIYKKEEKDSLKKKIE